MKLRHLVVLIHETNIKAYKLPDFIMLYINMI